MECLRYVPSFTPLSALKHTFLENFVKNLGPKFEIPSMAVATVLVFTTSMITTDKMRTDFLLGHLTDGSLLSVQDKIFLNLLMLR